MIYLANLLELAVILFVLLLVIGAVMLAAWIALVEAYTAYLKWRFPMVTRDVSDTWKPYSEMTFDEKVAAREAAGR